MYLKLWYSLWYKVFWFIQSLPNKIPLQFTKISSKQVLLFLPVFSLIWLCMLFWLFVHLYLGLCVSSWLRFSTLFSVTYKSLSKPPSFWLIIVCAWYPGLLEASKKSLATLQRKMVRFVSGMGPREHVADAEISSLGWLPFQKRVEFFVLMHVYKVRKALSPAYISRNFVLLSEVHSHSLRQSNLFNSLLNCPLFFSTGLFH